jgi:multicomponent Na+:H+ antiporter subunit E
MTTAGPAEGRTRGAPLSARFRELQPGVLLWLTVVWMALWGDLSAFHLVAGLLVAVVVCVVFPLPRIALHLRIRPVRLVLLVLRFLGDVVRASLQVSWITLQLHRAPRNAVIEVRLRTPSDFVLTVVAELTSLVPGSLVVEARRSTHTLFLHVLDAQDQAGVDKMRRDTLALERRVVLAFGAETDHLHPPSGTGAHTPSSEESR